MMSEKMLEPMAPNPQEKEAVRKIWEIVNNLQNELQNPKAKISPVKWTEKILELRKNAGMLLSFGEIDTDEYRKITEIKPVKR